MFQPHIIPHSFCFPVIEFPPVYAGVRSLFKKSHITAAKVEKKGVSTKKSWFYFSNRSSSSLVRFNVVLGISSILFFANSLSSLWN